MKIDKISYQKAYVIGPYLQHRIGVEIFLDEGEKPESVLSIAKGIVDSWHKAQYPEEIPPPNSPISDSLPTINRAHERLLVLIDKAKTTKELSDYYNNALNAGLLDAYNDKMQELSYEEATGGIK